MPSAIPAPQSCRRARLLPGPARPPADHPPGEGRRTAMRGFIRRAVVTIGAVAVLVFAAAGVASASGTVVLTWSPTTSAGTDAYPTINAGQKISQAFTLTNSGTVATSALKIALANVS